MIRSSLRTLPLLGAALIFAAGCDDDGSGPDDGLTETELNLVADQAANAVGGAMSAGFFGAAPLAPSSADPFEFTRSHTRSCPAGGEVTAMVSVSGDVTMGAGELTMDGSTTFTDCARGNEQRTVTMNGQLTQSGMVTFSQDQIDGTYTTTGEITWDIEPGEEGGSCSVDLTVTFTNTRMGGGSRSVTGTVCGREVDRSS